MSSVTKGTLLRDEESGFIAFTPDAEKVRRPENMKWLPLAVENYGKLQCNREHLNVYVTIPRMKPTEAWTDIMKKVNRLLSRLVTDKQVARLYEQAKSMKPHEVAGIPPSPEPEKPEAIVLNKGYEPDITPYG